jgi:DNA primase
LELADALTLVNGAAARLWSADGTKALAYLRGRGLIDETIKAARLGIVESISLPRQDGGCFIAQGVVIPWFEGDRLSLVKIRQPRSGQAKYIEAFRDRPTIFPGEVAVRVGQPLIIVEGEFDCLLLAQELGEAVVTLGSASRRPDSAIFEALLPAPRWFIAMDADVCGDRAATSWPSRGVRIRPPEGKDWTEFHATGFNRIRYFWGGIIKRPICWEALASRSWGPALDEQTDDLIDDYAKAERIAIQEIEKQGD